MSDLHQGFSRLRSPIVRLIVDEASDGIRNMAIDEALLRSVESGGPPVVRLYAFSPPALSVGRFQPTDAIFDFDALERDNVSFVRRPSAGRAVLHADELTYCVVLGKSHLPDFGKREVYRFVVPLLTEGLAALGVGKTVSVDAGRGERSDPDCFASTGEYEIAASDSRKLVGSAQMITRSGVLQHGSIPLGAKNRNINRYLIRQADGVGHEPSNVADQLCREVTFVEARSVFAEVCAALLPTEASAPTEDEHAVAAELARTKYGSQAWNRKY